jgi:hypothetical protein
MCGVVKVFFVHGLVLLVCQEFDYQVFLPTYVTKIRMFNCMLVASVAKIPTLGDLKLLNEILLVDDLREMIVDVVQCPREDETLR